MRARVFFAINDIRVVLGGNLEEQTNERFVYHDNCTCLIFDLVFSLNLTQLIRPTKTSK